MACKHFKLLLTEKDRYYINSEEDNNCVFCLINRKGTMTQDSIGKYLGLSKMRVSQIQEIALKKVGRKIKLCS
jgi:DNA-directed RNA polymerase sigma subunit (sigma70/sigma32)